MTLPGEIDGERFLRALGRLGWAVVRQRGSHRMLQHPDGRCVAVAFHGTVRRGAIRNTLRLMGLSEADLLGQL